MENMNFAVINIEMVFKTMRRELHHFGSEYIIYNQINLQLCIETPLNKPQNTHFSQVHMETSQI